VVRGGGRREKNTQNLLSCIKERFRGRGQKKAEKEIFGQKSIWGDISPLKGGLENNTKKGLTKGREAKSLRRRL